MTKRSEVTLTKRQSISDSSRARVRARARAPPPPSPSSAAAAADRSRIVRTRQTAAAVVIRATVIIIIMSARQMKGAIDKGNQTESERRNVRRSLSDGAAAAAVVVVTTLRLVKRRGESFSAARLASRVDLKARPKQTNKLFGFVSQDANTAAAAAAACQPGLRHVRGDDVRGTERQRTSECHKWIYCETLTTLTEFTRTRPFVQFVWGGAGAVSNRTGPDKMWPRGSTAGQNECDVQFSVVR